MYDRSLKKFEKKEETFVNHGPFFYFQSGPQNEVILDLKR